MKSGIVALASLAWLMAGSCFGQDLPRLENKAPASWHDPSPHRTRFVTVDKVDKDVQLEVLDWGFLLNPAKSAGQAAAESDARFAIYLVRSPTEERVAERVALKDLGLEERPILTEENIISYHISSDGKHIIKLKPGAQVRVAPSEGGTLLDRGFVVVAGGSRIYLGDFHAMASSTLPSVPYVTLPLSRFGEAAELQTEIEINPPPMMEPRSSDPRGDPRILKALQDVGKLDAKPAAGGRETHDQGASSSKIPCKNAGLPPSTLWTYILLSLVTWRKI